MINKRLLIIIGSSAAGALLLGGAVFAGVRHVKESKSVELASAPEPSPAASPSPPTTPALSPSPAVSPSAAPTRSAASPSPSADAAASPKAASPSPEPSPSPAEKPSPQASTEEVPNIKHLGVNLDYFNAATGMAGDFRFTKASLHQKRLWMDYAFLVTETSSGSPKRNPQPTFILPMGTKVRSLVDGKVISITTLYSNDYSIHVVTRDNGKYRYETEHVINPLVKVGDTVTAGQVIAEVSPHDSNYNEGMGLYEIGILTASGSGPRHICPFAYLDSSVKADLQAKITALYRSWEEYRGDTTLYDEAAMPTPGCETLEPIDE